MPIARKAKKTLTIESSDEEGDEVVGASHSEDETPKASTRRVVLLESSDDEEELEKPHPHSEDETPKASTRPPRCANCALGG